MWALNIQSSGGMKISTICAAKTSTTRMRKKIIGQKRTSSAYSFDRTHSILFSISTFELWFSLLAPDHDEDVFELRQVYRRDELGLGIEAADLKAAYGANK